MVTRYSRKALDHFMNPRNARALDTATGKGRAVNKSGDVVLFAIRVEQEVVVEAAFQAQGCAACIATASVATELMVGAPLDAANGLDVARLSEALDEGIPDAKLGRAKVTARAIEVAVADHKKRAGE